MGGLRERRQNELGRRTHAMRIAVALCLVLGLSAASLQVANAQGPISRCEPESIRVSSETQAQICIYVQDVVGLYGADFEMSFPGMLGVANVVDEDGGMPGVQIARSYAWVPSGWVVLTNVADNSIGYLHYLVYGWNPAPAIDGSGSVACMRFSPITPGTFSMTFTRHDLSDRDGFLLDNTAHTCSVTFVDPTAVTVSRFLARPAGRSMRVLWSTEQETDILGFNLYRADDATGEPLRLNDTLIPSKALGSPGGAQYQFADRSVDAGVVYHYWLDSIHIDGTTSRLGPESAATGIYLLDPSIQ